MTAGIESSMREPARAAPLRRHDRVVSIDVLRGFALLGILVMNIQTFSMIEAAYFNPTAYGDLTGANFVVWLLGRLLADQKFMTIFSMLFGAGIVLMSERAESKGLRAAGVHYRRMFWLILFGLLHAYLLWYGDILFLYGICGLLAFVFRKLRPSWLIVLGLLSLLMITILFGFFGWTMPHWPEEAQVSMAAEWQPPPDTVAHEVETYRGGWLEQMGHRIPSALTFQIFVFLVWGFWRAGGLMLIGMALYKLGFFGAERTSATYGWMIGVGALVGVPVVAFGVSQDFASGWDVRFSHFFGWQFNHWGSVLVSAGWVGAVMLVCKKKLVPRVTGSLAAVGQMALTNYLMHSLVCTTIFYGHGLGLFGRVERVGQIAIVFGIWALQLVVSPIWLRHFRFGPFEWLWRTLTYLKIQPMRRRAEVSL